MITADASAPLVVVVGATGNQGGSVIQALSESEKSYRIRGITRDTNKESAKSLEKKGVEMVAVTLSLDNKESTYKAFEGATVAFLVTDFWQYGTKEKEAAAGKLLVDAAHAAHAKKIIWSELYSCEELSGGKYVHVEHFEGKAEVTKYGAEIGAPLVSVPAAMYMQNWSSNSAPQKQEDGSFALAGIGAPDSLMYLIDVEYDYGLFVRVAIELPEQPREVLACSEVITLADMAKQMSENTGKTINYVQLTREQFMAGAPFPDALKVEMLEMLLTVAEFGYYGKKDVLASYKELARKPRTWAEFVESTDWSKILA